MNTEVEIVRRRPFSFMATVIGQGLTPVETTLVAVQEKSFDEVSSLAWLVMVICGIVSAFIALLAGFATIEKLATPDRIQAVTALGAYVGAKAAIIKGHRAEIEQSLAGLKAIHASGTTDMTAIIAALQAASVPIGDGVEGELIIQGGVILFSDIWAGTAQKVFDDARVKAVMAGAIHGFELALNAQSRTRSDSTLLLLQMRAEETR